MLSDQTAKVQFEIRNMFKVINRLTTNEITIFSPILTQRKFSKSIQKSFLSAKAFRGDACDYEGGLFTVPQRADVL